MENIISDGYEDWAVCSVVMLPTTDTDVQITCYKDKDGEFTKLSINQDRLEYHKNQHLYILSKEEIKGGDWFYNTQCNEIFGALMDSTVDQTICLKLVATTDKSLGLPLIPKSFIKGYCEKPVNKILVRLGDYMGKDKLGYDIDELGYVHLKEFKEKLYTKEEVIKYCEEVWWESFYNEELFNLWLKEKFEI